MPVKSLLRRSFIRFVLPVFNDWRILFPSFLLQAPELKYQIMPDKKLNSS